MVQSTVSTTERTTFRSLGAWPEKVVPIHISDAPQPGRHRPQNTSAAADHPRPINSTLEGEQGYMCQFSLAAHKTPLRLLKIHQSSLTPKPDFNEETLGKI